MKFGLFGSAQAQRGGPDLDSGQGFRQYIEYNVEAEALGYNSAFVVEHHFTGFGQVSASLTLLTWLAARTKTLRLGTAVMVLPWHNPVLLAEQAATIDLLSGGRLEFGVGKGYRHNEFASFCIPMEEADERFEEGLALVIKSWTTHERFSHHGKYWHFENIIVEPPTQQKPHPPIWMAAGSPDSIRKVARRGSKLLLDQLASTQLAIERFNIYKTEVEACGRKFDPMDVALSRAFFVAHNAEEKAKAIEARLANQTRLAKLAQTPDGNSKSSMLSFDQTLDAAAESAMFGTPDEIAAKLSTLRAAGVEHVLLTGPTGSRENLRAFARDVMPAFAGPAAEPPSAADSRYSRPRSAQACSPSLRRHPAADQAQHVAVCAVAVLRRRGNAARLRHRAADGDRRHRLGQSRRPHGWAVRHQPLPGVLSGRPDHRSLRPQARHPVRPRLGDDRHLLHRPCDACGQRHRADARHGDLRQRHQCRPAIAGRRDRYVSAATARAWRSASSPPARWLEFC